VLCIATVLRSFYGKDVVWGFGFIHHFLLVLNGLNGMKSSKCSAMIGECRWGYLVFVALSSKFSGWRGGERNICISRARCTEIVVKLSLWESSAQFDCLSHWLGGNLAGWCLIVWTSSTFTTEVNGCIPAITSIPV